MTCANIRQCALCAALLVATFTAVSRNVQASESDLTSSGTHDISVKIDGDERKYRIHIPKSFDKRTPVPLIIALHGAGATGKQTERMTGFSDLADKKGFVVVYPEGENKLWRYVQIGGGKKDFAFIEHIMDSLVKAGTADPRRIYLTGISNGAYLSNSLAIEFGDKVAAIAPIAGTLLKLQGGLAKPKRPIPVCAFHGTEDPIVGYEGADVFSKHEVSMGAEACAAWWAGKNGCEKTPKVEKLNDTAPNDGTTVEKWTYAGDAPVEFYKIVGGGHNWPGMQSIGGIL